jgi:hypothetical protein
MAHKPRSNPLKRPCPTCGAPANVRCSRKLITGEVVARGIAHDARNDLVALEGQRATLFAGGKFVSRREGTRG